MVSRAMEFERRTVLVQFINVDPLTFYATSDGTDLVQDILRRHLVRPDKDIFGQEGSISIDDHGEFLTFEPTDTKNRTLHLPIEHLAYCGALRRMRRDPSDQRNPDQIIRRDFENVDLANRYAHLIMGPPIFIAVFHGFDNALCYTFITQSADDACLLVMKLTRAFRQHEQQLEQQGQEHQGLSSHLPINNGRSPSPVVLTQGNPLYQSSQPLCVDQRQILPTSVCLPIPNTTSNMYLQEPCHDDFVQRLLSNPNLQIINSPYCGSAPITTTTQHIDNLPFISAPTSSMCYSSIGSAPTIVTQQNSPVVSTMLPCSSSTSQIMSGPTQFITRPPSPPILGIPDLGLTHSLSLSSAFPPQVINGPTQVFMRPSSPSIVGYPDAGLSHSLSLGSAFSPQVIHGPTQVLMRPSSPSIVGYSDAGLSHSLSLGNTLPPQVVYKPNNQEINYKQNVIVRWLKPPTPPPPAPIIIREIQQPPEIPPPIIYRHIPPCPPTPPPIVVREQPPPCPVPQKPVIIEKRLPKVCLPPQVVVERCPPPPPKPQTVIYERYLPPPPPQKRQVIVQRETCQPTVCTTACTPVCAPACTPVCASTCTSVCAPVPQPTQCRRVVREIVRQVPQQCTPAQPAVVCTQQNQQKIIPGQQQVVQQFVPVYSERRHIVQPRGIRVIRQVVGPAQPSTVGQYAPQIYSAMG